VIRFPWEIGLVPSAELRLTLQNPTIPTQSQCELQSLSEVVGTHVVLACKWIITVFYTQYRSPPPPPPPTPIQSMLFKPKYIKPDEKWDTTLNRGRGDCRLLKFKGFVASVPRLLKLIV
jgi:hypothetical protein